MCFVRLESSKSDCRRRAAGSGSITIQHGVNSCDCRSPLEPISWRDVLRAGSIVSICGRWWHRLRPFVEGLDLCSGKSLRFVWYRRTAACRYGRQRTRRKRCLSFGTRFHSLHVSATPRLHHIYFLVTPCVHIDCRIADRTLSHKPSRGCLAICPSGADYAADGEGKAPSSKVSFFGTLQNSRACRAAG
jgi:hypothetical protein